MHPPLQVWKLGLLLISTATIYQFVWLYRIATDLRSSRDPSITVWHWVAAPLLGPLVALPGLYLATYLKDWQVEENKSVGHFAEPVLVGMFMLAAYLPFLLLIINPDMTGSVLLITALLLCLPYLFLQGQLNLNKSGMQDRSLTSRSWAFARHQLLAMGLGVWLAIPLYVLLFTNIWETWGSEGLAQDFVVQSEQEFFQIRIADEGWSQVSPGNLGDDSDMEFLGPDQFTWSVVYDSTGLGVDEIMSYRIDSIREEYERATCQQKKTLIEDGWIVTGTIECTGRSALLGEYIYASRVLRRETKAVEIIGFTAQRDATHYRDLSQQVRRFVNGLEIVK